MATTTNYSWTTPDDTALVKDGAAAIRTLGSSADTTVKGLNPGTTSGDLDYYTSSTAKARIGIGTNGQVLTSNGSVPSWAAPAASSPASDSATVATSQTTTSTTYTDLATAGPAVTITTGTKALVIVSAGLAQGSIGNRIYMSYAVSGATTIAASDTNCLQVSVYQATNQMLRSSSVSRLSTLTAGSNTFTAKYRTNGGTATIADREICVINLGS
jgi:hypothetical protein